MTTRDYTRPPVLDRIIVINGVKVDAKRVDFAGRDVLQSSDSIARFSKSLATYTIRHEHSAGVEIGDTFVDDVGNNRTIVGITVTGRDRYVDMVSETLEYDPQGPDTPAPTGNQRTWDLRILGGNPFAAGEYRVLTNGSSLWVHSEDADGATFDGFTDDDMLTLTFGAYTATATVSDAGTWRGFGGQSSGPSCTLTPAVDMSQIGDDESLVITFPA